jgi:hypothetical protein
MSICSRHLREFLEVIDHPGAEEPMLHAERVCASLVFFASLMVSACGAESPSTPTPSYYQSTSPLGTPGFGGASSTCHQFNSNAPGETLADEGDNEVVVNAPAGWNNVRLSNPNPSAGSPTLYSTSRYFNAPPVLNTTTVSVGLMRPSLINTLTA